MFLQARYNLLLRTWEFIIRSSKVVKKILVVKLTIKEILETTVCVLLL
jgi:hypothetical protein